MVVAIVAEEPHAPVLLLHVTVHRLPATSKEDSEWRAGRDGAVLARKVEEVEKEGQDGERDPAHIQPEAIGLEEEWKGKEERNEDAVGTQEAHGGDEEGDGAIVKRRRWRNSNETRRYEDTLRR